MPKKPTQAKRVIPADYDDRLIAISDPVSTEIVAVALSHVLFAYKDRSGASLTYVHRFLRLYASTEILRGRSASPAPDPAIRVDVEGWGRATARKRLKITADEEAELYETERRLDGALAKLPAALVAEYVPIELWPVIGAIASDGPSLFERRVEQLLHTERNRRVKTTRRRPTGGHVSESTLMQTFKVARRVVDALRRQAAEPLSLGSSELEQWRGFKMTIKCPPSKAGQGTVTDNSPPPTHQARLAFRRLNDEVRSKLALTEGFDECEAIEETPYHRVQGLFTCLRNRAIFVCLGVLSPRIEELLGTKRGDFVAEYRFLGGVAPAIFLEHHKNDEPAAFHPMPDEAAQAVRSYLAYMDRWAAETGGEPLSDDDPLFVGQPTSRSQHGKGSVEAWFGGSADVRRAEALMPIHPDKPDVGYRPHGMRKRMTLWCSGLDGERWCRENEVEPARLETIGNACLAHDLSDMTTLYRGDTTKEGKEQLRYWGASLAWEMLAGERGRRKIADAEGFRAALREAAARRKALENLEQEIETLCIESERTGKDLSPASVLGRMQKATRWARELSEIDRVLVEIEAGLPRRLKSIDDEIPDAEVPRVDLDAIKEEELNGEPVGPDRALRRLRNWITPDELARIIGRGPSTVREWVRKGAPQKAEIWDRSDPPIREFGKTRRAILVDGINEAVFDTPEKRAALAECLAQDPPPGWSHLPLMTSLGRG
jgi:hypothetical protein